MKSNSAAWVKKTWVARSESVVTYYQTEEAELSQVCLHGAGRQDVRPGGGAWRGKDNRKHNNLERQKKKAPERVSVEQTKYLQTPSHI